MNYINLKNVKNIYDIAGTYIWQYGKYQSQYTWDRSKYKNIVVLVNKNTKACIKKGVLSMKKKFAILLKWMDFFFLIAIVRF